MIFFWMGIFIFMLLAMGFIWVPVLSQGMFRENKLIIFIATLLLSIMALLCYLSWGDSQDLRLSEVKKNQALAVEKLKQQLPTPEAVITALKERLQQDPQSAKGWYLLGKVYLSLTHYSQAIDAFAKAERLEPMNTEILFQYAQANYLAEHRISSATNELLNRILKLEPRNPLAINLLAIGAYESGDYQKAVSLWEELLPLYSPASEDGQALLQALAKAQQALAMKTKK